MRRLKYERENQNLSQYRLAADAGINPPRLSLIERGRKIPTPEELRRLADILNVYPPEDLLKDIGLVTVPAMTHIVMQDEPVTR